MTGIYNILSPILQKITSLSLLKTFARGPLTNHRGGTQGWRRRPSRGAGLGGGAKRVRPGRTYGTRKRHFRPRFFFLRSIEATPGYRLMAGEGNGVPSLSARTVRLLGDCFQPTLFQSRKGPESLRSAPYTTP